MEKNLFKKVIVGFAFSPNLRANVFESIRLAKNFNAKLFFIHVGEKTDKKEKTFNEIIKSSSVSSNNIEILWRNGDPVKVILLACEEFKVDLLLLGALKRENVFKFYMGSIARKLTRKAPCSVLLLLDPSEKEKPTQHIVVNAFESVNDKKTVSSSLIFANSFNVPKVTLVEEINSLNLNLSVYDDKSLIQTTLKKEKIKKQEETRVSEILNQIPDKLKSNVKIQTQSTFGTRGYSTGHYAKVVRADLLIMYFNEKKTSILSKFFPKDLDHILGELPTNVLILKN